MFYRYTFIFFSLLSFVAISIHAYAVQSVRVSFEVNQNGRIIKRTAMPMALNRVTEILPEGKDNLFVQVRPEKKAHNEILMHFTVGEIDHGKRVAWSRPSITVKNGLPAMISVRETVGSQLVVSTTVKY